MSFNPVRAFEKAMEDWLGSPYAVAVSNGTAAIKAALLSVGVHPRQWVITTPYTFVATGNAIHQIGARPLFVDVKEDLTIDPARIWEVIDRFDTDSIGAILPVHIFGRLCDIDGLVEIHDETKIPIVEDACQAIGAVVEKLGNPMFGKHLGTLFDAGCMSFYGSKNLWTYEGGMVLTPHKDVAKKIEMLRNHGFDGDKMVVMGYNWKMGWINAFQGWQQVKMHKKAIVSELGMLGPEDGYYPYLVYQHPWYQHNPQHWDKLDCPVAEAAAEKVRGENK